MSISALELRLGMSVVGTDGRHVGRIKQIRGTDFLIDRRFRRDVYVPLGGDPANRLGRRTPRPCSWHST